MANSMSSHAPLKAGASQRSTDGQEDTVPLSPQPLSPYLRTLANRTIIQSQRDDLLRDIRDNPNLNEPRFRYAQHLENAPLNLGDKARAELIRLQISRLADQPSQREREILLKHERDWMRELGHVRGVTWNRGFVTDVTMSPRAFAQAHESLIREPVTHLRIHLVGGSNEGGNDLRAAITSSLFQRIEKLTFWIAGYSVIREIQSLIGPNLPKLKEIHFERCVDSKQDLLRECNQVRETSSSLSPTSNSLMLHHVALTFGWLH